MNNQEITSIYDKVTDFFIKEKRTVSEVKNILVNEGIDNANAQIIIDEISDKIKKLKMKRAKDNIIQGIVFIIVGIIFCVEAYMKYENLKYIGAVIIIWGAYKIIKGFISKSSLKHNVFSRTLD